MLSSLFENDSLLFTDFKAFEVEDNEPKHENSINLPVDTTESVNEANNENNDIVTGNMERLSLTR